MTAEVYRSLALFITYAYHRPSVSASRTPKSQSETRSSRYQTSTANASASGTSSIAQALTKRQLGTKVLEMYTNILCEHGNITNIQKFARTVTNKVGLFVIFAVHTAD